MAELAEQVDLLILASACDFSIAHFVIYIKTGSINMLDNNSHLNIEVDDTGRRKPEGDSGADQTVPEHISPAVAHTAQRLV